jgi:hypothetical protein
MTEIQRKFPEGARVIGKEESPGSFRGRTGTVTGFVSGSGYQVSFDDGRIEYAYAYWLEGEPPKA